MNSVALTEHQQALLLGDLHLSERRVRALVARAEWEGQRYVLLSESEEGAPLQVDGDARGPGAADTNLSLRGLRTRWNALG